MALAGARSTAHLREDTRSVGEGIANWSAELPKNLTEGFFELLIDYHVLVDAKVLGRELVEAGD